MNTTIASRCLVLFALAVGGCNGGDGTGPESAEEPAVTPAVDEHPVADLKLLLAGDDRAESDRVRDAGRRPADVLAFLGIGNGMHVMDVFAAGGYYTEVLSLAVGSEGHVAAQNPPAVLQFRDGRNEKAISARLAGNRLANVKRLDKDFPDLTPDDGPFDAAITALNFHDIYNRRGPDAAVAALQAIARVLKPGGVLGIIDHIGEAGSDNTALHRIEIAKVLETVEAAGFIVDSDSDLLRNETDDHSLNVFDEAIRGNTDRFLLKVRKPNG